MHLAREVSVLRQPGSQSLLWWWWHHKNVDLPRGADSMTGFKAGFKSSLRIWMHMIVMFAGCLLFSLSCFLWTSLLDCGLSIAEVPQLHGEKCTHGLQNSLRNEGCAPWWRQQFYHQPETQNKSHQCCIFLWVSSSLFVLILPQWEFSLGA